MVLSPGWPGASIGDGNAKAYAPTIKHGVGSHARFHLQGENRSLPRTLGDRDRRSQDRDAPQIAGEEEAKLADWHAKNGQSGTRATAEPKPLRRRHQGEPKAARETSVRWVHIRPRHPVPRRDPSEQPPRRHAIGPCAVCRPSTRPMLPREREDVLQCFAGRHCCLHSPTQNIHPWGRPESTHPTSTVLCDVR